MFSDKEAWWRRYHSGESFIPSTAKAANIDRSTAIQAKRLRSPSDDDNTAGSSKRPKVGDGSAQPGSSAAAVSAPPPPPPEAGASGAIPNAPTRPKPTPLHGKNRRAPKAVRVVTPEADDNDDEEEQPEQEEAGKRDPENNDEGEDDMEVDEDQGVVGSDEEMSLAQRKQRRADKGKATAGTTTKKGKGKEVADEEPPWPCQPPRRLLDQAERGGGAVALGECSAIHTNV